jgi:hypothetical protein
MSDPQYPLAMQGLMGPQGASQDPQKAPPEFTPEQVQYLEDSFPLIHHGPGAALAEIQRALGQHDVVRKVRDAIQE